MALGGTILGRLTKEGDACTALGGGERLEEEEEGKEEVEEDGEEEEVEVEVLGEAVAATCFEREITSRFLALQLTMPVNMKKCAPMRLTR